MNKWISCRLSEIPKEKIKGLPKHEYREPDPFMVSEINNDIADYCKELYEKYGDSLERSNLPPKINSNFKTVKVSTGVFKLKIGAK